MKRAKLTKFLRAQLSEAGSRAQEPKRVRFKAEIVKSGSMSLKIDNKIGRASIFKYLVFDLRTMIDDWINMFYCVMMFQISNFQFKYK